MSDPSFPEISPGGPQTPAPAPVRSPPPAQPSPEIEPAATPDEAPIAPQTPDDGRPYDGDTGAPSVSARELASERFG